MMRGNWCAKNYEETLIGPLSIDSIVPLSLSRSGWVAEVQFILSDYGGDQGVHVWSDKSFSSSGTITLASVTFQLPPSGAYPSALRVTRDNDVLIGANTNDNATTGGVDLEVVGSARVNGGLSIAEAPVPAPRYPVFVLEVPYGAPWTDFELKASRTNFGADGSPDMVFYFHSPGATGTEIGDHPDVWFTDSGAADRREWLRLQEGFRPTGEPYGERSVLPVGCEPEQKDRSQPQWAEEHGQEKQDE